MANNQTDDDSTQWNGQVYRDGPGHWFASNKLAYSLDVVTLLTVIGEKAMADHAPSINASSVCWLPRILPAPQAFLNPVRPTSLPHVQVKVIGVLNGVEMESISLFAESLLGQSLTNLPKYSFHAITIRHTEEIRQQLTKSDMEIKNKIKKETTPQHSSPSVSQANAATETGQNVNSDDKPGADSEVEKGPGPKSPPKRNTGTSGSLIPNKKHEKLNNANAVNKDELTYHIMLPKWDSPLRFLTVASFFLTLGVGIAAGKTHDGMAVIAIIVVGTSSSLIGIASYWEPVITTISYSEKVPNGDTMLITRAGAYVYIRCPEPVSRELFAGVHTCKYKIKNERIYQMMIAIATVLIMISVIFLGNCIWEIKVAIGSSYILLNLMYWICSMVDRSKFWDLSRYEVYHWGPKDYKKRYDTIPAPANKYPRSYINRVWDAIGQLFARRVVRQSRTTTRNESGKHQRTSNDTNSPSHRANLWKRFQLLWNTLRGDDPSSVPRSKNCEDPDEYKTDDEDDENPKRIPERDNNHPENIEKDGQTFGTLRRRCPPINDDLEWKRYNSEKQHDTQVPDSLRKSFVKNKDTLEPMYCKFAIGRLERELLDAELKLWGGKPKEEDDCFTKVAWYAIRASRQIKWAEQVLPKSDTYRLWLRMAEENLAIGNLDWRAVNGKNAALAYFKDRRAEEFTHREKREQLEDYLAGQTGIDVELAKKRKQAEQANSKGNDYAQDKTASHALSASVAPGGTQADTSVSGGRNQVSPVDSLETRSQTPGSMSTVVA